MSGGRYDYAYRKVEDFADDLRRDGGCDATSKEIRNAFAAHCRLVARAMKAIEWNDSGDGDDNEEKLLLQIINKKDITEELRVSLLNISKEIDRILSK